MATRKNMTKAKRIERMKKTARLSKVGITKLVDVPSLGRNFGFLSPRWADDTWLRKAGYRVVSVKVSDMLISLNFTKAEAEIAYGPGKVKTVKGKTAKSTADMILSFRFRTQPFVPENYDGALLRQMEDMKEAFSKLWHTTVAYVKLDVHYPKMMADMLENINKRAMSGTLFKISKIATFQESTGIICMWKSKQAFNERKMVLHAYKLGVDQRYVTLANKDREDVELWWEIVGPLACEQCICKGFSSNKLSCALSGPNLT